MMRECGEIFSDLPAFVCAEKHDFMQRIYRNIPSPSPTLFDSPFSESYTAISTSTARFALPAGTKAIKA